MMQELRELKERYVATFGAKPKGPKANRCSPGPVQTVPAR